MSRAWTRIAAVLLSAGMYCLAFPPWNLSLVAWIALVPFLVALRGVRPLRAALLGFAWGTAVLSGIGYWVPGALSYYWEQPYWFGFLFALGVAVVFMGQYFALFAIGCARIETRWTPWSRPFLIAALYVSCELARARLLTGHPWLLLGYALVPHVALVQIAELGGVYLLSFVLALTSAFAAECFRPRGRAPLTTRAKPLIGAAFVVLTVWLYGTIRLSVPLPSEPEVPVMVVQGNNDLGAVWHEEFYGRGLEEYLRLTSAGAAKTTPRLVVWPESAVTFFLEDDPTWLNSIMPVLERHHIDLIVGGPRKEGTDTRFFNSAFYLTPEHRIESRYDKVHLLPFAEYFPLRTIQFLRRHFERVRYFTAAETPAPLHTRFGDVATLICFEAIFPEVVRQQTASGAVLMVNLSNDGWFGRSAGADQHLMMVALRAVENRLWVVRATTTGISAIVDPYGRITTRAPVFTAGTIDARVVPMNVTTPYERVGDLFAWLCVLLAAGALLGRPRAG